MRGRGLLIDDTYDMKVLAKRNAEGKIVQGLLVGNTLYQNQTIILGIQPGEIKLTPMLGAGLETMLLGKDYPAMRQVVTAEMQRDRQKVKDVAFTADNKLEIDAIYS